MPTSSTLMPLPRHWPQSDSSTTSASPKAGTLVFQLALGAFVGLIQRFVEYHFGFGWLTPGLLSVNGILPALDGVFGAVGSMWLGIDSSPPMQLAYSGPSLIEAPLEAQAGNLVLSHIRRTNSTVAGEFEFNGDTNNMMYAYALLVCIMVTVSAGVWLVLRHSAWPENAFSTSATSPTGSGESDPKPSKAQHDSGKKCSAPKQGRGASRREWGFKSNDDGGDAESDLSEGDDDDDDDDDDPPPPPGSGSQFLDDDEGYGRPWTVVGGKFILGSIVMGMWKVMKWLRWVTTRTSKRPLEVRSFEATIAMEKYENEWDVLTGSYILPRRSPPIPSSTAKPSTLQHAVSTPAILSVGPSLLAQSAVAEPCLHGKLPLSIGLSANESVASQEKARKNSTAHYGNHVETGLRRIQGRRANVGTMAKKKRRIRNMRTDVSKLKARLRNLVHEFVETFGLMAFAMLFIFPLVTAYLGLEFGDDDEDFEEARQESQANGGPQVMELESEDVGNIAAKGSDEDGVEVGEPGQRLAAAIKDGDNESLELSQGIKRDEGDEDEFVYLNERVCATFRPHTPTPHYIPEMVESAYGPLDEGCDTDTLAIRTPMDNIISVNALEVSPSETAKGGNLDDHACDIGGISTMIVAGDDDEIEMIASLIQMVFQYHDQLDGGDKLESKVEMDVAEPQEVDGKGDDEVEEDDRLSEVGSYVTAEDSEIDWMDDEVDLVHEELESCAKQMHQPSLEASELTNLYAPYSDQEHIRCVDGSTTEERADDSAPLFPGSFLKPQVAVPLWSAQNCWAFTQQPSFPSNTLRERERESWLPPDAVVFGLPRSDLNVESTSDIGGNVYLTPPQVNSKVFPGSPPAVPRGRKSRLREKLMREEDEMGKA